MLLFSVLGLGDLGRDLSIVLTGVPDDGGKTQESRDDGEHKGDNSLGGEGAGEGIGSDVGTGEVQALVTGSVTAVWDAQSLAVLNVGGVDLQDAGHDLGSLNEGGGETSLEMPLDVAMEQPNTRVVCLEADGNVLLGWDENGVTTGGVGGVDVARVGTIGGVVLASAASDNLEDVTVEMEGVVTGIVVVDDNLDPLVVLDDHGVGVLSVDLGVGREVASGQGGVQGGDLGHDVGDVVEGGLVAVVVQDAEGGGQGEDLVGELGGLGDDGNKESIVEGLVLVSDARVGKGSSLIVDDGALDLEFKLWRDNIEHGGVHVGVQDEVLGGIGSSLDKDRVTLSSSDREAGDDLALDIDTVDFNDLHLVSVNVEVEHGKGRHVDDTKTVGLARDKVELGISLLVDQSRLGDGLGAGGVEDGEVLLQHNLVLSVVPVSKGDGVLLVVLVGLVGVMDNQGTAKTIDVLASVVTVDPVGTVLLDGDGVSEVGAWGDGALGDHGGTIELGIAGLEETVGVQTGGLVNLVDNVDDKGVTQGHIDSGDGKLAVDTDDTTLVEAVRVGVDVGDVPVVGDDGSLGGGGSQGKESQTLDRGEHHERQGVE